MTENSRVTRLFNEAKCLVLHLITALLNNNYKGLWKDNGLLLDIEVL